MTDTLPTIHTWLHDTAQELQALSTSPQLDAQLLLCAALECERAYVFTWPQRRLSTAQAATAASLRRRRCQGEPIAYILGEQEFWSLSLMVDAHTLIPRPDTEVLVELALGLLSGGERILDLGTGSGAIAIALAHQCPDAEVVAVDNSPEAVAVAEHNRRCHRLTNLRLLTSDWFSAVSGPFDMIVANPPYICADDAHLSQGDLRFEPRSALVAAEAGLADLRQIIAQAPQYLRAEGYVLLEHGWQQGRAVRALLRERYGRVHTQRDYGDRERVSWGQLSAGEQRPSGAGG